jgi:SAM-dependent methyltransferase
MPHPDHPYRQATPDQLAVAAVAHGLTPPPPATARVLELGCGAGGTLLAVAAAWPRTTLVGLDVDAGVLAAGRALAAEAGLEVDLLEADVREIGRADLGAFDYVIAHGVYSWVASDVRDALFAAIRAHLAPGGLGYVSHAALPAGHLLRALREGAQSWGGGVAGARELLAGPLAQRAAREREGDWYGAFLRHELPPLLALEPEAWETDLLGPEWHPEWFHAFAAHLARHDLAYVGESRLLEPATRVRRAGAEERLRAAADGDRVVLEQLRDLADGRHFREAVVTAASPGGVGRADPDPDALPALFFTALDQPDRALPAHAEHADAIARLRARLLAARPAFPSGAELGVAGAVLLEALAHGQVLAHVAPPPAAPPGDRPRASPLARAQAARETPVTTLVGSVLALDAGGAALVALLDGTRDRPALRTALRERTGLDLAPDVLDAALHRFGQAGALLG